MHNNDVGILAKGPASATLDGVTVSADSSGVEARDGAHLTLSNSTIANNQATAVSAWAQSSTGTVLVVVHPTITANAPYSVRVYVLAPANPEAKAFVETSGPPITTGFQLAGIGGTEKILSSGDNRLVYYNAGVPGGALASLGGI
jgi:hypothetical protein